MNELEVLTAFRNLNEGLTSIRAQIAKASVQGTVNLEQSSALSAALTGLDELLVALAALLSSVKES